MLQDASVEIDNVERAVGAGGEIDGPEALIGRRQELTPLVSERRPDGSVGMFGHVVSFDQVRGRLGDEGVAVVIVGKQVPAVDGGAQAAVNALSVPSSRRIPGW